MGSSYNMNERGRFQGDMVNLIRDLVKTIGGTVVGDVISTPSNNKITNLNPGAVPVGVASTVSVVEYGNGIFNQTAFTFTAVPITVRDIQQGKGVQIYTFPTGRICRIGASGSIAVTTTSVLASTLHAGVTCNWGIGSTTQANGTLATTEQDFLNVANFTSSATINVAGAVSKGVGAGVLASLDGTTTPIALFLNLSVPTGTDIDADATVTVTGSATINWVNL